MTTETLKRTCAFCADQIPATKKKTAKYCHTNCGRKAVYHRKSPIERAAINKQSNDRRFRNDLLPIIRGVSCLPDGLTMGSPAAQAVVKFYLIERLRSWKWDLALNFLQARTSLERLAGGPTELERLEDWVFETSTALMQKGKAQ